MSLYRQPGMLMYWTHTPPAPWQTDDWLQQMRQQLRASAYLRLIENRFVSGESDFIDMEWWDRCVNPSLSPILIDRRRTLPLWIGCDASTKKDSTAQVACTFEEKTQKVRLVWHRTFQPSPNDPLNFEDTVERTLLEMRERFPRMQEIRFDPWQMVASAQRLTKAGLPMVEFPQTVSNLTEASQNLYDLIKGGNITMYPDPDLRLAVSRAVAKETGRGWKIGKERQSDKIDLVVALAQAALGAVKGAIQTVEYGGIF
jgi:phage terminase large subunit-like protein